MITSLSDLYDKSKVIGELQCTPFMDKDGDKFGIEVVSGSEYMLALDAANCDETETVTVLLTRDQVEELALVLLSTLLHDQMEQEDIDNTPF